jgi:PAS domain S-box-containing protein
MTLPVRKDDMIKSSPLRVAVLYAVAGALWIFVSDGVLHLLNLDQPLFAQLSTFKGWAFIAVTALALHRLIAREHRKLERYRDTIRAQEVHLRNVLETLPVGVWLLDREGNIAYGNPAGLEIWGGSRLVDMGQFGDYKGWWLATGQRIEAAEWGAARAIMKGESSLDEEIEIEGFDGVRRVILHSAVPLRDAQHEITGAIVVNEDITARKRSEEERNRLLEERDRLLERLQLQFERMPIGCIIVDRELRVVDWNPAAEAIFGYKREEILGKNLANLIVPPEVRPFTDGVTARLLSGEMTAHAANENITRDGRTIIGEWFNTPLINREGEVTHILSMVQDVSERQRAEREIYAYQEELRFLASEISLVEERQRRQLATFLHDQIGQTLAIARIKLGSLLEGACPGECAQGAKEVRKFIDQAIRASRSLTFDLSPPILYEIGLEAAVQSLCERYQEEHGIRVRFSDDRQAKPVGDEVRVLLFQAVRELLVNIFKHARAQTVTVSCCRDGKSARITVEDDGVGFDSAAAGIRVRDGRGFGLFSIRERLRHLGGSFDVASSPGHGTRVVLAVPLLTQQHETEETR